MGNFLHPQKVCILSLLNYPPIFYNQDLVGVCNRGQSVSHDESCLVLAHCPQTLLDVSFSPCVQRRSSLASMRK